MLRVPIGSTDFSTRAYTLDDVPNDDVLENFSLSDEDYTLKVSDLRLETCFCLLRNTCTRRSTDDQKVMLLYMPPTLWSPECGLSLPQP